MRSAHRGLRIENKRATFKHMWIKTKPADITWIAWSDLSPGQKCANNQRKENKMGQNNWKSTIIDIAESKKNETKKETTNQNTTLYDYKMKTIRLEDESIDRKHYH